ncbi:uncharacterized protein Z518_02245 [Rhinocladiella mackenziei CBS 650.93]|uniref:Rhinocladiella mackenziei CBS 650.93 unplaced genomic scaffold supercont1.2, whole genome shotgun sequence n=1 Tax=Rhinocladiella mackenziei CBS 650.93 TaxID=1442369 RepID=A0A0D2FZ90_9EURO|nr:uncharacterized protein Z518_02245 [Rhinocladiella mackenziei CBS 650.93]KIX07592.1 hypothetical protein Z518_02245 [Rhinocladiella mackenziei CBS 650.93]
MSFRRWDLRFKKTDNQPDQHCAKPPGLRVRRAPSHQCPISQSSPPSVSARRDAPVLGSRVIYRTPSSTEVEHPSSFGADRGTRENTQMGSASRHLLFKKSPEEGSAPPKAGMAIPSSLESSSPQKLIEQRLSSSTHVRLPVPSQGTNPPPRPSPSDKPLPSLPIATVKFKSPVRKSLTDCTALPLRRSISPVGGGAPPQEDWPTMQPSNLDTATTSKPGQSAVKPSLGESFIEGMHGMNLEDMKDENAQPDARVRFESPGGDSNIDGGFHLHPRSDANPFDMTASDSNRPLSSSQLPKPRDSVLESLSRHINSPSVRQTKTSALRLRRSIGKRTWGSSEKSHDRHGSLLSIRERAQSPSIPRAKQASAGGPIRSASRGRHGVTGRGTPYTIPRRPNSRPSKTTREKEGEPSLGPKVLLTSESTSESIENNDTASDLHSTFARQTRHKSSTLVPIRTNGQSADVDYQEGSPGNCIASTFNEDMSFKPKELENPSDFDETYLHHQIDQPQETNATDGLPQTETGILSGREALSNPALRDDDSMVDSDVSEHTVHGYDSFGGFRVKRVRNAPKGGPTLRITDSASRILLGDGNEDGGSGMRKTNPDTAHKTSALDIRKPAASNDQGRRPSGFLTRPLSFARSITDRSLTRVKNPEDDETGNLIQSSGSAETVHRAEFPGSDVDSDEKSSCQGQNDVGIAEAVSQESSEFVHMSNSTHRDWPCKDFAGLRLGSEPTPPISKDTTPSGLQDAEPVNRPPSGTSNNSRHSTVALRAAPSREISPFLFRDLEHEQYKQGKQLNDVVQNPEDPRLVTMTQSKSVFPPRTSSRKLRPPPITVSPPDQIPYADSLSRQAIKAYSVHPDMIQKPGNVAAFSRSISPNTSSSQAPKYSNKLSYSPSSSGKKVISNLRGLFHKHSTESTPNASRIPSKKDVPGKLNLPGSVRRKPMPGNKITNPPLLNAQGNVGTDTNRALINANEEPCTVIRNPFISPMTPFTATVSPSPNPTSQGTAKSTSSPVPSRPSTPSGTPTLSTATSLTHVILDLARAEPNIQHKTNLIDLSKSMVEVVITARDAEKAAEKAKMEAARAEVCWLKVQKEVGVVEGVVRDILGSAAGGEKRQD